PVRAAAAPDEEQVVARWSGLLARRGGGRCCVEAAVKSKSLGGGRFALVFDKGDEPVAELERFARERGLTAASFTGIGAFEEVVLGYFDRGRREYAEIPRRGQV